MLSTEDSLDNVVSYVELEISVAIAFEMLKSLCWPPQPHNTNTIRFLANE